MKTTPRLTIALAGLAAAACISFDVRAAVHAFDSFEDYTPGLIGVNVHNGGIGWDGAWKGESSGTKASIIDVSTNPLVASNGVSGGNMALSLPDRAWYAAGRDLLNTLDADDGYYISYLIRLTDDNTEAWLFNASNNRDHRFFGIDADSAGDVRGSAKYGAAVRGGPDLGDSGDYMLVAKIFEDSVTVWLDPTSESDLPVLTSTANPGWPDLDTLYFMQNRGGDDVVIDRLILGETFADVMPVQDDAPPAVPEPASAALAALGAAGLLLRRRSA